ncbi:uncharacterized protein LOC117653207 [Thrips palmi]|uniref:Uncharacterized protein LOC117653207 n=1 Tax=Thrips palmi TaxID=161013 RepID=A0A6P9AG66_THRPL|nr:uncharacterized protein LOC117653207 [Thrips palmi]
MLTVIDRWTRWPEAIPLQKADSEAVTAAFLLHWVARFGAPQHLTCDRGSQFQSHLFKATLRLLGTQQHSTTAYHPQASGMLERWHRPLKAALMCHEDASWATSLPWVLLGLRSSLKDDLGASTADLVYGEPLRLPGALLTNTAGPPPADAMPGLLARIRRQVELLRPQPAARHGRKPVFTFPEMATATHAYLRDDTVRGALAPPYSGPHAILARDAKTVTLQLPRRVTTVSVDRVKPAFTLSSDPAATKFIVSNCPPEIHDEDLKDLLAPYGRVVSAPTRLKVSTTHDDLKHVKSWKRSIFIMIPSGAPEMPKKYWTSRGKMQEETKPGSRIPSHQTPVSQRLLINRTSRPTTGQQPSGSSSSVPHIPMPNFVAATVLQPSTSMSSQTVTLQDSEFTFSTPTILTPETSQVPQTAE